MPASSILAVLKNMPCKWLQEGDRVGVRKGCYSRPVPLHRLSHQLSTAPCDFARLTCEQLVPRPADHSLNTATTETPGIAGTTEGQGKLRQLSDYVHVGRKEMTRN